MLATVVLLLADDIQLHLLLGETYIESNFRKEFATI